MPECENCWLRRKESRPAETLADSIPLCSDCHAELKPQGVENAFIPQTKTNL